MRRRRFLTVLGASAAGAAALTTGTALADGSAPKGASRTQETGAAATLIQQARIFDGERVVGTGDVLLDAGKINQVASRIRPQSAWQVFDGRGKTLLPGLIDAHVHLSGVDDMSLVLQYGVTTVLEMNGSPQAAATKRDAASSRDDVADYRTTGWGASGTGGALSQMAPQMPTVDGPEDADDFVAARVAEGSDYIKILVQNPDTSGYPEMSEETIAALAAAARRRNLLSIAHAPSNWAFRTALDARVSMITHGPLDEPIDRAFAARAAADKRVFIPTMVKSKAQADSPDAGTDICCAVGTVDFSHAQASIATLHKAGLPLLVGTDSHSAGGGVQGQPPVPFGPSTHQELALLVAAGLKPVEALAGATARNAHYFGLPDRGRIAPGYRADLLLVDGDPTTDISATQNISGIWRRGAEQSAA